MLKTKKCILCGKMMGLEGLFSDYCQECHRDSMIILETLNNYPEVLSALITALNKLKNKPSKPIELQKDITNTTKEPSEPTKIYFR